MLQRLERHRLADGSVVEITKLGRYNFNHYGGATPECRTNLSKADAYGFLEAALRADVLEQEA